MSTGLLERFVVALETIAAASAVKPAPASAGAGAGAATPPKPPAANAAAAGKAADKAAADKVAAAAAAKAAAAAAAAKAAGKTPTPVAGTTKAPGGKHNAEQVRDIIRKVANNSALGKASARGVLEEDGGGVTTVSDLKPEHFDAVYEACQVLLSAEGGGAADDDFDPTA